MSSTIDRHRWQAVKTILSEALSLSTGERVNYVERACDGDLLLRDEVVELLALDGDTNQLEVPAISGILQDRSLIGTTVDRYTLIAELGTGGMGAVYLAERNEGTFVQRVALKLIRSGLNNREIITRFLNERQILASLTHDNIARLIDGGTTAHGDPFLVMEYVEGVPITDYALAHDLSLDERLSVFVQVCSAVSFAHQNLVIHRDLKPSNILVTNSGVPKLLDFGIAKIVAQNTSAAATATQRFVFTPEYASPEQVRGETLTTATDVYSLGVILYHLLVGKRPYDTADGNITKIIEIVCKLEPTAPSRVKTQPTGAAGSGATRQMRSSLKGDLDNIVLKALRKEPEHRYASVADLSTDIQAYLAGLPVAASSGTWRYKAGKFVRRNRLAVGAAALLLIALLAGLGTTLYQARIASIERSRAERRFNDVRQLANSFVFEINDEIEKSPIKARALVVERAIEYLDNLAAESGSDDSLIAELASAYEKIGDVQSELFRANLGNSVGALESQRKSLALRQQLSDRDPTDGNRLVQLAKSHLKVGNLLTVTGDVSGAQAEYRKAADISGRLASADRANVDVLKLEANSHILLGQATLRTGSLSGSLAEYQKAFAIDSDLVQRSPNDVDALRRLSVAYNYMGYVRVLMGDPSDGAVDLEHSSDLEKRILATDPQNARYLGNFNDAQLWVGIGYRESGRIDQSLELIRRSIEFQEASVRSDSQNMGDKNALADCWQELGQSLARTPRTAEAIRAYQTAIKYYSEVVANDKDDLSATFAIQLCMRLLGDVQLRGGHIAEAVKNYQAASRELDQLTQRDPSNLDWRYELAMCKLGEGKAQAALHRTGDADGAFSTARPLLVSLAEQSPENVHYKEALNDLEKDTRGLQLG